MMALDMTTELAPVLWGMLALLLVSGGAILIAITKTELANRARGCLAGRVRFRPASTPAHRATVARRAGAAHC